jgi:hypothetical protein
MLTWLGSKPPMSSWSSNCPSGFSRTSWNTLWVVQAPMMAFSAIQVGASSQTPDVARRCPYRRRLPLGGRTSAELIGRSPAAADAASFGSRRRTP